MNKKLLRLAAVIVVVLVCVSMVAMAAPAISSSKPVLSSGTYTTTVDITGVGTADKVSLLVVKAGTDLTRFTSEDILYVAQKSASSGTASFEFVTTTNKFDVYSGYTAKPRTQDPLKVGYVPGPDMDISKSELYSNESPFGKTGYKRVFIKLTEENGKWVPDHSEEGSEIYYSTELQGYDGLIKTTSSDIGLIFSEINWEKGTPSKDATISMYGDVTGDGAINVNDYVSIRKSILGSIKYSTKQNLTADVADDADIRVTDYIAIRRKILGSITGFDTVINRK